MLRIALTGGGTGGHIYPLIAVANSLRAQAAQKGEEVELHYIGSVGDYRSVFEQQGIEIHTIVGGKIRRYVSFENILDIPKFFIGMIQAWIKLYFLMPDAIFSKGGTGSFPVLIAGWFYRIPIMIHESDTVPGLNNLLGSKLARRVAVSFEKALKYFSKKKGALTGSPLREDLLRATQMPSNAAKEKLGFDGEKPLMLVMAGSQGSQRLNELILITLPQLVTDVQVLHQTGEANFLDVEKLSKAALLDVPAGTGHVPLRYEAVPYLAETLGAAYAAADVIVSRAGSSIAEFAAFGKPAILIPLHESANDHQRENAYAFAEQGGGIVIEEPNLLPDIFLAQLHAVLRDPARRQKMADASRAFFIPGAAEAIAAELLALAA